MAEPFAILPVVSGTNAAPSQRDEWGTQAAGSAGTSCVQGDVTRVVQLAHLVAVARFKVPRFRLHLPGRWFSVQTLRRGAAPPVKRARNRKWTLAPEDREKSDPAAKRVTLGFAYKALRPSSLGAEGQGKGKGKGKGKSSGDLDRVEGVGEAGGRGGVGRVDSVAGFDGDCYRVALRASVEHTARVGRGALSTPQFERNRRTARPGACVAGS
eukprot:gene14968-biopygen5808